MFSADYATRLSKEEKADDVISFASRLGEGSELGMIHTFPDVGCISVAMGIAETLEFPELVVVLGSSYADNVTIQKFDIRDGDGGMSVTVSDSIKIDRDLMTARPKVNRALKSVVSGCEGIPVVGALLGSESERMQFILQGCCRKIPDRERFLLDPKDEALFISSAARSVYRYACMPAPTDVLWVAHRRAMLIAAERPREFERAAGVRQLTVPSNPLRLAVVFEDRARALGVVEDLARQLVA